TVINGDQAVNANAFDGLEKALVGASTEMNGATGDTAIDLSNSAAVTKNYTAFLDVLDEFLHTLDGTPTALLCNTKLAAKLRACARRASMYQSTPNSFGEQVERYGNIPFVDLGAKAGSNTDVIATDATTGATSLYAVRFGLDGFHGVSMAGQSPIRTWMPDFSTAGAVKKGEVEMVAAVALKATKAAAVLRKIKVV
ncbi:MAG: phage capsid protein, partial [Clostridia bacterium]